MNTKAYEELFDEHGTHHMGLFRTDQKDLERRFEILLDICMGQQQQIRELQNKLDDLDTLETGVLV